MNCCMPTPFERHQAELPSVVDHFVKELQGLRTGRASAAMVAHVRVDAYGQSTDLQSVASITTPDAKTIQIEPWDATIVKDVEKALIVASLGMMPTVAGTVIRLGIPPMTEDGRKQLAKTLHQKAEQAKISLRNLREKIRSEIADDEKNKRIGEDDKRRQNDALEKIMTEWNDKITTITTDKEREIMTI